MGNTMTRLSVNARVENFAHIKYTCIENHHVIGESMNFCLSGKWLNPMPECQPRCSASVITSITFLASCYLKNNNRDSVVRCTDPAVPGTKAHIICKYGYENQRTPEQMVTCENDGRWSPLPTECAQICGERAAEGTPLIFGGEYVNIIKVPWHVGIYKQNSEDSDFIQQCGGTIINSKVVISAAHCFWNRQSNKLNSETLYRVVAGKYYRAFNDPRENNTYQTVGIEKIIIAEGYIDYEGLFSGDIAILILNNYLEYKINVAPICITNYKFDEKIVPPGTSGLVAGWGLVSSGGDPSDRLKQVELPVIQREQCLKAVDQSFRPFLTSDKFCAGLLTGVGVCVGDSGGGLVFSKTINGHTVYYLRGIVSIGHNKDGSCDIDKYAVFTNTAHFWDLIQYHELANRPKLNKESYLPETSSKSCFVDHVPDNGFVTIYKQSDILVLGKEVQNLMLVQYACIPTYHLIGNEINVCVNGSWSNRSPNCEPNSNSKLLTNSIIIDLH